MTRLELFIDIDFLFYLVQTFHGKQLYLYNLNTNIAVYYEMFASYI